MTSEREPELRYAPAPVTVLGDGALRRIGGLGVPYETQSRLLPAGFREIVAKHALNKAAGDGWPGVVSRMEHHPEWLLGSTDAGTMRLHSDPNVGLDYEVDLPDTTAGNDTYVLTKRGDLRSASIGFICFQDEWTHEGQIPIRRLLAIRPTEVSPVSQPAYVETRTALRHLAAQFGEDPDEVLELARQNELRALFTRTDRQVAAPPTVLPTPLEEDEPIMEQDNGIDPDLARRRLLSTARKMAMDGDPRALEQLQGTGTLTLEDRRRRNAMWEQKIRIDDDDMARLRRGQQSYPQPNDAQRQQQAALLQAGIKRRMAQLAHDESVPVGFVDHEAAAAKPLPQKVVVTPRPRPPKDGWLA